MTCSVTCAMPAFASRFGCTRCHGNSFPPRRRSGAMEELTCRPSRLSCALVEWHEDFAPPRPATGSKDTKATALKATPWPPSSLTLVKSAICPDFSTYRPLSDPNIWSRRYTEMARPSSRWPRSARATSPRTYRASAWWTATRCGATIWAARSSSCAHCQHAGHSHPARYGGVATLYLSAQPAAAMCPSAKVRALAGSGHASCYAVLCSTPGGTTLKWWPRQVHVEGLAVAPLLLELAGEVTLTRATPSCASGGSRQG